MEYIIAIIVGIVILLCIVLGYFYFFGSGKILLTLETDIGNMWGETKSKSPTSSSESTTSSSSTCNIPKPKPTKQTCTNCSVVCGNGIPCPPVECEQCTC